MARLLIFGSKGWIGKQVLDIAHARKDIDCIIETDVRADDMDAVKRQLDTWLPTHVISTIGRTHGNIDGKQIPTIDYLEYPGKLTENIRDNLFSPIILAKLCCERNIHFTYLGTGCIFEYEKGQTFTEDSKPNFFGSEYSIVKGFTDQLMSLYESTTLNVRIRMPITATPNPRDFITKILGYEKICSVYNSMSVLDDLLPLMVDMAITKKTGTINLTNPGTISHAEILEMYKEIVDPTITWNFMSYEEQSALLKSKRSNNELDTSKLLSWYPNVPHIRSAVRKVLTSRIMLSDTANRKFMS
jgi:dTDP-4-dehydrorhamnose reductase